MGTEDKRAFMRAVVAGLADIEAGRELSLADARARLGLESPHSLPGGLQPLHRSLVRANLHSAQIREKSGMSVSKKADARETSRRSSVGPKGVHLKFHGADFVITASGNVQRIFPDAEALKALAPSEALTRYIESRTVPSESED